MKLTERRTQLYLTEEQYQAVSRVARDRRVSLAAVVREAIEEYVAAVDSGGSVQWAHDAVRDLAGALELPTLSPTGEGGADLDEAIDESVYDEV